MLIRWKNHLAEWRQRGIITPQQEAAILAYEAERPGASWVMTGLVGLALFIMGLGVISLVAANWEAIPDGVKLGADFALLGLLAWGAWHHWDHPHPVVPESLLVLFTLCALASIGLISQIYHTGGRFSHALLFWCLITLPLSLLARQGMQPHLWAAALLYAVFDALTHWTQLRLLWPVDERLYLGVGLALPPLAGLLHLLFTSHPAGRNLGAPFRHWAWSLGVFNVILLDVILPHERHWQLERLDFLLPAALLGVALLGLLMARGSLGGLQRLSLTGLLALYLLLAPLHTWGFGELGMGLATIAWLALAALLLGSLGHRRGFQVMLLLLGYRVFRFYLQALGGLAMTGVGLLLSGLALLGLVWLWRRYRTPLTAWVEGLS